MRVIYIGAFVILICPFGYSQSKKQQLKELSRKVDSLENLVFEKSLANDSLNIRLEHLISEHSLLTEKNEGLENQLIYAKKINDSCSFQLGLERLMNINQFDFVHTNNKAYFIGLPELQNWSSLKDIKNFSERGVLLIEEKNGFLYTKCIANIPWSEGEYDDEIFIEKYSDNTICYLSIGEPTIPLKIKALNISTRYESNSDDRFTYQDTVIFENTKIDLKLYFIYDFHENSNFSIRSAKLICETNINGELNKYVLMSEQLGLSVIELLCVDDLTGDGNIEILVSHKAVGDGYHDYFYIFKVNSEYDYVYMSHTGGGHTWLP